MNRVLLYINEILVSLDIPPIVKTTVHKLENRLKRESKQISKDEIK